jgi:hypothetical protein
VRARGRPAAQKVRGIIAALDAEGRWLTTRDGDPLPAAADRAEAPFLSSEVFIRNLEVLSAAAIGK